jgi:adenylyl-sulfate kinase
MTQTLLGRPGGFTLWFTGMSGAGKSTLTNALAARFREHSCRFETLDGDEVRTHLSKGLSFSKEDRDINIDRIGYVARLLARNGVIVITAAISPYAAARDAVRAAHGADFDALAARDPKGLYKKALVGEIAHFTGLDDPYEPPMHPEIVVRTDRDTVEQSTAQIWTYLNQQKLLGD